MCIRFILYTGGFGVGGFGKSGENQSLCAKIDFEKMCVFFFVCVFVFVFIFFVLTNLI